MAVLVTGGAGFIGSHVLVALAASGRRCVSIDNYSNSTPTAVERVQLLTSDAVIAYEADICDPTAIRQILSRHRIDSVIHLAGLKAVAESLEYPQRYHQNNVIGTRVLLDALAESEAQNFVFSSSATVYGNVNRAPIAEDAPTMPQSPYGMNKLEIERMLAAFAAEKPNWRVANLRYFNPIGAHPSGSIGEDPSGVPNNLMPYISQVASGRLAKVYIFGNDYPTIDGTGVRDFIHVMDLAEGHIAALQALERASPRSNFTVNLGTGRGISVLELIQTFERVNKVQVAWEFAPRRAGDVAVCYADVALARKVLRWEARRNLEEMCRDAWRWQDLNPTGYPREAK